MYVKMVYKHDFFLYFLYPYIKMLNSYYQKNKENIQKETRERYQNLSEEEKEKRQKKAQGRYKILSKEEKEKKASVSSSSN